MARPPLSLINLSIKPRLRKQCILFGASLLLLYTVYNATSRSKSLRRFAGIPFTAGTCRVPAVDIWPKDAPKVSGFPRCTSDVDDETRTSVWIHKGRLRIKRGSAVPNDSSCSLFPVVRVDDFTTTYGPRVDDVEDGLAVKWPSLKVICQQNSTTKPFLSNLLEHVLRKGGGRFFICGSYPPQALPVTRIPRLNPAVNILLIGLDSVSRVAALRYMPKTMAYLNGLSNSFLMQKQHIVGDGTTANVLAMLTGYFEEELPEARKSHVKWPQNHSVVDDYPWIWNTFAQSGGYATHYIEDIPSLGTFHYRLMGFGSAQTPTHSFGRPCTVAAMQEEREYGKTEGCIASRYTHATVLESVREFFYAYADRPRFSLTFITDLVHENPAYAQLMDDDLVTLFKEIEADDAREETATSAPFADTMVLFFSDHGSRIGSARLSIQGKLEERLSLLNVIIPRRLAAQWPEATNNLHINTGRLTTLFDVHATFAHILHRQYGDVLKPQIGRIRGQSLFTEIPINRTCAQATIASHWCTCLEWFNISRTGVGLTGWSTEITRAAEAVVKLVNSNIDQLNVAKQPSDTRCSPLVLSDIISAESAQLLDDVVRFVRTKDNDGRVPGFANAVGDRGSPDMLLIRMDLLLSPLDVRLEATVRMSDPDHVDKVDHVRRDDRYESKAWCQPTSQWPQLRQFCVCLKS